MPHALPRRLIVAAAVSLLLLLHLHAQDEVRALWVVRTTLTSPSAIAAMVAAAKSGGVNTLLVQVRGRGDAYSQNGIEPRPVSLATQPSFDPLATTIAKAHEAGLHWAGIGAYRLSSGQIVENAQTARRLGVGGIILFSYDSLADAPHGPGYVTQVGRAAFQ